MLFMLDARNQTASDICDPCCCETIRMKPGEIRKLTFNGAAWAMQLMGGEGIREVTARIYEHDPDNPDVPIEDPSTKVTVNADDIFIFGGQNVFDFPLAMADTVVKGEIFKMELTIKGIDCQCRNFATHWCAFIHVSDC